MAGCYRPRPAQARTYVRTCTGRGGRRRLHNYSSWLLDLIEAEDEIFEIGRDDWKAPRGTGGVRCRGSRGAVLRIGRAAGWPGGINTMAATSRWLIRRLDETGK